MATGGSMPVILKKFSQSLNPGELKEVQVSEKFRVLVALGDDSTLRLWNVKNDANFTLVDVIQFKWSSCSDCQNKENSEEDCFVVLKIDGSIELHTISNAFEGFSSTCNAVVTKELLKGLLNDRGKEWHSGEVNLISLNRSSEPSKHEVIILVDTMLTILSMGQNSIADMLVCFEVTNSAMNKENEHSGPITAVRMFHKFIFTLVSSGVVFIHKMADFVGSINMWQSGGFSAQDYVAIQERPTFVYLEVTDDLSFLVCGDGNSNIYMVNLDEYFKEFPSQWICPTYSKSKGPSFSSVKFQYELEDEDSVARNAEMSDIAYGDRVWKTEILAFRKGVKQACCENGTDVNHFCIPTVKKRWFSDLVGPDVGHLLVAFNSCGEQTIKSCSKMSGFNGTKREAEGTPPEVLPSPEILHKTIFVRCEDWMKVYKLKGIWVTPASFLLCFKPQRLTENPGHPSDVSHGVLCLFSLKTQKYLYHWFLEPSVIVQSCEPGFPHLVLTGTSLAVPAFDISQDQLVHKVIMYENAVLADSLCFVNQWDHCTIPIHALEVALKLRQLDTVAFFLKNQDKAFTNRCAALYSSSDSVLSSLSSASSLDGEGVLGTTDVVAVTEALVSAVNYNSQQQHHQHFTRQLAQMTLSYLHNLMEDGAKLLDGEDLKRSAIGHKTGQVAWSLLHQEIKDCLDFLTLSIVKLRGHLSNIPLNDDAQSSDSVDFNPMPFARLDADEVDGSMTRWSRMKDEDIVEDAIANQYICSAQAFFQSRRLEKMPLEHKTVQCDGSLSSFTQVGLQVVFKRLIDHDMETVTTLLTNMGRDVWQQLHKVCLYTLHRPLRDFLLNELESRDFLPAEERNVVEFSKTLETLYNQPSFTEAKKNVKINYLKDSWRDLGLLKSSFNLGSAQILDTYIQSGNLTPVDLNKQDHSKGSSYVEVPLAWVCSWDEPSRQRIVADRIFSHKAGDYSCPHPDIGFSSEALWEYLSSHMDWQTLLGWIRSIAHDNNPPHDDLTQYVGAMSVVHDWNIIFPSLPCSIFSGGNFCHKVVKAMIMEELSRNGLFTTSQLSNFPLLLRCLSTSQALFGHSLPFSSVDGGFSKESLPVEGCLLTVSQFHLCFVDYCIRLRLINLLYHYIDIYGLCESKENVRELNLESSRPHWVDMLIKCRLLGLNSQDPCSVLQASLAIAGFILRVESPSIMTTLKAGHPELAISSLLYGPNTLSQAIVSSESQSNISVWQVEDKVLHDSLLSFPKVHSAVFPVSSGSLGIECQDVSVYRLLQGNSPFEISRLFGWQPTNDLAPKGDTSYDMQHFSCDSLVFQHAHRERLTFSYYLRHGRPSFAFVAFIGEKLKDVNVSKASIQKAALKAYRVAIQNLTNPSICAACVVFTEMLGMDSMTLRVDIQAASRLLAHGGSHEDLFGDNAMRENSMADAIASELLSCSGKGSEKPLRLLVALKTATRNIISKDCLDKTSFEAGQLWSLVVLFCRVHKMEFPVAYLQDCAVAEKWLPFICHAQACQVPKEQVIYVIEHNFSNSYIQEHLLLAFENVKLINVENVSSSELGKRRPRKRKLVRTGEQVMAPSRDVRAQFYSRMGLRATTAAQPETVKEEQVVHPSCSSSAEDEESSRISRKGDEKKLENKKIEHHADDTFDAGFSEKLLDADEVRHNLFDILFKCQSAEVPWRSLLAYSITLQRSLLSVLATCFQDSRPLDCLCAWLCSTVCPSVLKPAVASIPGSRRRGSSDVQKLQWHDWTLGDLTALILAIVETRETLAHTLAKAFYIFDPASPLLNFFRFHETFLVLRDYETCQGYLTSFKNTYRKLSLKAIADKHEAALKIGSLKWLEELTCQVTKHMLSRCDNAHQQGHLLAILAASKFGRNFECKVPAYCELHEVSKLLHGTNTNIRLEVMVEQGDEADSQAEKERVLGSLLNTKQFAKARRYAELMGLSNDHITIKQVDADLEIAKNSMLWEIEQGRLAFWHRAEKCFKDNGCKADTAGSFFENQASDTELSFSERAMLVGIAVKWFSNPSSNQQPRPLVELEDLQKKRWLYKIRAEIEKEGSLTRSVSHLEFLSHEMELELSSEVKTNSKVLIPLKAVDLKELIQEDTAEGQPHGECPLETDKEIRALENIIGCLLEHCHVSQAQWLASLFNHSCLALDVVMSCIHLAQGTRSMDTLDVHVKSLLTRNAQRRESLGRASPFTRSGSFIFSSSFTEKTPNERHDSVSSSDWVKVEDIITTMESLAFHSKQGKRCCSCVITCYKVAQTLGQDYEEIVKKKPLKVLHSLLLSGFDSRYKMMEGYIKAVQLDSVEVTEFLASIILNSLIVHCTGEDISGKEYSDLTVNAAPSCEDISHMIRLCPDYSVLGTRLLDEVTTLINEHAPETIRTGALSLKVELLVRAHQCHTLACNMEGIAAVLRHGRVLTTALTESRDYMLMVRLLTGIGRFNEMSYIIDTLFEHEHFELLCRKGIDQENKLKVALLDYLRKQHPEDTDKFSLVAHHFRMYREIAQTLEDTAVKQLASLGNCFPGKKHGQGNAEKGAAEVFVKLNSIMKSFCYASDNYAKENCWRHSQTCLKNARLVHLQIQFLSSGVTVVNLNDVALKKFLAHHTHFFQSLLVADAYKKRDISLWVDAIYNQVVMKGNFNYLQDMSSAMPLANSLFVDVVTKYKSENARTSQAAVNMKRLLGFVTDVRMRYKLAIDLNFCDLGTSILEGDGGAFLRDVMVP